MYTSLTTLSEIPSPSSLSTCIAHGSPQSIRPDTGGRGRRGGQGRQQTQMLRQEGHASAG